MSEKEAVLKTIKEAGKPMSPGDIAKALGIESKAVSKATSALKKEGKIHSPKRDLY